MSNLLKAKPIIDAKLPKLLDKSRSLAQRGLKPKLCVILVGDNPASMLYINNKRKKCEQIEAGFELIQLAESVNDKDFLETVKRVNNDPEVTGCFVQLPVPKHLQHIDITQLINPKKDVDGFHLNTINQLYLNDLTGLVPCTPRGIVTLLAENKITIQGKHVVIIGRSLIVGKPLSLILNGLNATVTLCHSHTEHLESHTKRADIIVCAIGIPEFLKEEHISPEGKQIIIDVGINKKDNKTVGDADFEHIKDKVAAITPVPGGVGPMTVFSLMENLLKTTETILKDKTDEQSDSAI
ncbi:MAG: bifunctional methylenetetrahydrofolate dehydrogenase/methenyltetrahydrofolate cyclohydrolase [Halobacteriovoraceae bacterium]|nr:bifunctional methylenetetrahydrofolate dehydrogenase/methenyltetrahydrofolate cyclohydrolase [Halobacteriovoraceae bacterium]|tara:strand:+ start:8627 stop:9514 length:888 start_codon:yes stop_codon:yes gene_type:complete